MSYVIGVDLGTSAVKTVLGRADDRVASQIAGGIWRTSFRN